MAAGQAIVSLSLTKLGVVAPFVLAMALYLIGPFLTARVKTVLQRQLAEDARRHSAAVNISVPAYLRPEMIYDYVEYVADAVQIIPATLLPVLGAVLAIAAKIAVPISVLILVFAIIVAVAMDALVLSRVTADYMSRKWHGYSIVSGLGILVNIFCIVLILVYG